MTRNYRTGLVVGKFCPLHLGHEFLISQAARQCETVVVISYTKPEFDSAEFAGAGPGRRERWLRARFPALEILVLDDERLARACVARGLPVRSLPHNDDSADKHRRFVAWVCTALLGRSADVVFTSEDYGDGFAAVLAEYFGTPVAHVCVDRERQAVPASGTAIRADIDRRRALLAPEVYADFVRRACFLGGESSGKSTLAERFARAIGSVHVPEFGRHWWHHRNGCFVFDDMLHIGRSQVEAEDRLAASANGWLSCDTSPLTTLFYSLDLFDRADPALERLAARAYDAVFLCAPDFPFVQDGTRREAAFRTRQHAWYVRELTRRRIPFVELTGPVEHRLATVIAATGTGVASTGV